MSRKPIPGASAPVETDDDAPWPPQDMSERTINRIELENMRRATAEKRQGDPNFEPRDEELHP